MALPLYAGFIRMVPLDTMKRICLDGWEDEVKAAFPTLTSPRSASVPFYNRQTANPMPSRFPRKKPLKDDEDAPGVPGDANAVVPTELIHLPFRLAEIWTRAAAAGT
jgi:hypothetical protein